MKALAGAVSLLVVLAIVALAAARGVRPGGPAAAAAALPASGASVRSQARAAEQQVRDDVTNALQQGADARLKAADAP